MPKFDSEDAIIKHSHFSNSGEILKFHYNSNEDFCEEIFKLVLSRIAYENRYHEKYEENKLTKLDIENICSTLNSSNYSQKDWLFAELILKDIRTNTHSSSKNFIKDPLPSYRLSTTTTTGEDLFEIILEDENCLFIMWDARNDKSNWVNVALDSKLKELFSKKRYTTEDHIRVTWENNSLAEKDIEWLIAKRQNSKNSKSVFILTWKDNVGDFSSFIDNKLKSNKINESTRKMYAEIKKWTYNVNYLIMVIDGYEDIFKNIIDNFKEVNLKNKLQQHVLASTV